MTPVFAADPSLAMQAIGLTKHYGQVIAMEGADFELARSEILAVVGDNAQDLLMGRAAGAGRVIGVLTGTGTYATLAPLADLCLASIAGIEAALFPRPSATLGGTGRAEEG